VVSTAIQDLMAAIAPDPWDGTATELLSALEEQVTERVANSKRWPASAAALGSYLSRVATPLRRSGIEVARDREARSRTIIITKKQEVGKSVSSLSSLSSSSSVPTKKSSTSNAVEKDDSDDSDGQQHSDHRIY